MRNLLYKELTLSINKFFYVLPIMLSLLFFIPNWFYTLVIMYFFWITVPQVYYSYIAQQDFHFNNMLPVTKKEIVQSKVYSFIILEMIHIVLAVIFGIIHNIIYKVSDFGLDINASFFGLMFVIVAVFNIIFLPQYFKTGYRFGKPLIAGVIATLLIAGFFEYSMFKIEFIIDIFKAPELGTQLIVLLVGIILFITSSIITMKQSIVNYQNIG